MPENQQSDFMIEKIKQRPINRKKLLRRTVITASMAVIFGLIACVTFLVLEPIISNWLYPEEEPQTVVFPEDQEEMSPEEMLAENLPAESPSPAPEPESDPEPGDVVLSQEQIEEIRSGVVLDRESYKELYSAISSYIAELQQYMVTVTAVTSNLDWFSSVQESRNQTSGIILNDNGRELLVLADARILRSAESMILTFNNGEQANAQIKQMDSYTGLAVLAVPLTELPPGIDRESLTYPSLGSSNSSRMAGTPVVAMGSPMGTGNSVGYGIVTTASHIYSVPDRNYKILQTDINGSRNASGVLFNLDGQIVGIITDNKTNSGMEDVVYAYGITDLKNIMIKMSNSNRVAYLGITGLDVTSEANRELGVPLGGFVTKVDMESPAMLAGIQQGDVIVAVGDREVTGFNDYTGALMLYEPGQTVDITIMRQSQEEYKEMNFSIEVGEAKK
ncbi:MAG: PDZ domain-containing protein [Butyrivibrio sp.]|nr:PDZ domain-containing protein [Acetatifactor muris]MCM1559748.1 PDZ domain-containing protein [Butyrivibrio sp.]